MSGKFTAKDVQSLRQKTGVGMMECKTALEEANGDLDEAISILRKKGAAKAAKKADRIAAEGIVSAKIKDEIGVVLEINSETDFVAKNDRFKKFSDSILEIILKNKPKNIEELQKLKTDDDLTVEQAVQEEILTIGENIKIRRFSLLEGNLISYVHGNGSIAVLVKFNDDVNSKDEKFIEYAKNIAMQVAACSPQYINPDQVPEKVLNEEKEILKQQVINSGKPENIADKIVKGRINKFFKDVCLNEQEYVKDNKLSVKEYTKMVSDELKNDIKILNFIRMEKGEGVEKASSNFADEIFSMLN